jgi:hypothetical protein
VHVHAALSLYALRHSLTHPASANFSRVLCIVQCTDFPFSLGIRHPQYVGSVLTLWGFVALLWDPAQRPALLHVALAWTGLYGVTAVIEDKF